MLAAAFVTAPLPWLFGGDGLDAWLLLPWLAIPLALPVAKIVRERTDGPSLNGALAQTGMLQLAFCTLLSVGPARELSRGGARRRDGAAAAAGAPARRRGARCAERELVRVRLRFGPGDAGEGEAAPLEPYDGVPLAAVLAALDAYAAVLADAGPEDDAAALLDACRAERPLPQALAAIDLALWDRAGRRAGGRWRRCSAATRREPVAVNALVGAEDRAGAARAAAEAAARGLRAA